MTPEEIESLEQKEIDLRRAALQIERDLGQAQFREAFDAWVAHIAKHGLFDLDHWTEDQLWGALSATRKAARSIGDERLSDLAWRQSSRKGQQSA